jgi:uncharacterized protein (TIGR04551 family)
MRLTILVSCLLALAAPTFAQAPAPVPAEPEPPAAPEATEPPPATPEDAAAQPVSPAQDPTAPAAGEGEPVPAPSAEGVTEGEATPGALTPPSVAPIELPQSPVPTLVPDPSESSKMLEQAAPPPPVPEENRGWTAPETVFQLHGYFRLRGNLLKNGWLGHSPSGDRLYSPYRSNYDPFTFFQPADRRPTITPGTEGEPPQPTSGSSTSPDEPVLEGCGDSPNPGSSGRCKKPNQVSGDMRLRLKPEIHLSDDVRVKAWIDVLDNVGAGTMGYGPNAPDLGNAIRVRRAWGEARNRDIGELRFGRMGADWGLGILDNGGDRYGIDSDFSSDVDRVMGITNLAGFYFMAAYDWASEGDVMPGSATPSGVPIDNIQSDDLDAFTFSIAHRLEPEAQQSALLRGEAVFNYGAYFIYRDQLLQGYQPSTTTTTTGERLYARLDQTEYIPDLWVQFLWEGLRVEVEAAYHAGQIEGNCPSLIEATDTEVVLSDPTGRAGATCKLRQLGVALETEYRLFDDKLGLYLFSGFASGDSQARGLAATNDPALQRVQEANDPLNDEITTYQFNPDYRVDMILWRTLMRRVAGAYYIKPGVSYDFLRDPYGKLAGGRFDLVYSRASRANQTWGGSGNLGLELDISLYYRSEDGPDLMDGFYGLVQWGVLFPFRGLEGVNGDGNRIDGLNAMMFRGVAGVSF